MTTAKAKGSARPRAAAAPAAKAAPAAAPAAVAKPAAAPAAPAPVAAPVVAEAPAPAVAAPVVAEAAPAPAVAVPVVAETAPAPVVVAPVVAATPEPAPVAPEPAPVAAPVVIKETLAQIEHAVAAGKETIEQVVKASKDAAAKGVEKAVALAKDPVAVKAQAAKAYEDTLSSAKENMDAMVKAGQVLTQGMQDIGKSVAHLAHEAVEEGVEASKKLLAAKTLKDAVDVQSTLAKAHLDRMLAHSTQLTSQTVKMFETAFAPMQARVTAAIEKLVKPHH